MAATNQIRTESGKVRRVIVVGGGLAGLTTTLKLAEAKVPVDLISLVPVKRSHSVCAQGGINASINTKGEGDSPRVHLEETAYGGDFLANQPPVKGMADAAPGIVFMLDRMGVPFNRTPEGLLEAIGAEQDCVAIIAPAVMGKEVAGTRVARSEAEPIRPTPGRSLPKTDGFRQDPVEGMRVPEGPQAT